MAYKPVERTNILIPLSFKSRVLKWSDERVGKLIKGAFLYVLSGEISDFSDDETLSDTFDEYRERLDQDGTNWDKKKICKRYARWCGILEQTGKTYLKVTEDEYIELMQEYNLIPQPKPPFDDWLLQKKELRPNLTADADSISDFDRSDAVLPWT